MNSSSSSRPSMSFGLAAFKFKMQTKIATLERLKKRRQEDFGVEYLKLAAAARQSPDKQASKICLQKAVQDMDDINQEIESCHDDIESRERGEMEDKIKQRRQQEEQKKQEQAKNKAKRGKKGGRNTGDSENDSNNVMSTSNRSDDSNPAADQHQNRHNPGGGAGRGSGRGRGGGPSGGRGRGRGPAGRGRGRGRGRGGRSHAGGGQDSYFPPMSPGGRKPLDPEQRLPKRVKHREAFQPRHSPEGKRSRLSAVNLALAPEEFKPGSKNNLQKWTHSEWKFQEYTTNGGWTKTTEGIVEKFSQKSITRGIQKFKMHPQLFIAMMYPTPMLKWPENEQEYTLIYRDGTTGLRPKGVSPRGQVTFLMHEYQPLPSLPKDELPKKDRDEHTDKMTYRKQKLITKKLPAYLPGRGTGLLDDPRIKIIGEIDPSDIAQGQVGDCWLLSAIAALAEFNGAVQRLFRKTQDLDQMPFADGRPNMYTITLWNLTTWEEVDIVVDERLPARKDIRGALFGAKASQDGELWVCYLEKAIAAHCGGWDKIDGGQCTHAWSLLTGCKDQYIIQRVPENPERGPFGMWAKYDPDAEEWAPHGNSPSEGHQGVWRVPWPELGGGGVDDLDEDDLFLRLCAWSDQNYLIGASSKGESDRNSTNGVVDNHAYSVIDCRNDVAATGIDLIQVRNPWGYGGIENGQFARKGKGWKAHPEIQKALQYKELEEDDGVFWVTKHEFFKHYHAIYVGAMNMKTFLGIEEKDDKQKNVNRYAPVADPTGGLPSAPLFEEDESDEESGATSVEEEAGPAIAGVSRRIKKEDDSVGVAAEPNQDESEISEDEGKEVSVQEKKDSSDASVENDASEAAEESEEDEEASEAKEGDSSSEEEKQDDSEGSEVEDENKGDDSEDKSQEDSKVSEAEEEHEGDDSGEEKEGDSESSGEEEDDDDDSEEENTDDSEEDNQSISS